MTSDKVDAMSGISPYNEVMTKATDRVEFRITPELKEELETASAIRGLTTSAFVKDAALRAARATIQEEHLLVLGADDWEFFVAEISRPGKYVEGLADLFRRPSIFTDR